MKVIIIGCGKLGSGIARILMKKGHNIIVIDENAEAFELLGEDFPGEKMVGIGFDRDVLEKVQIRKADAVVACSKSDEANALIGRLARNIYKVPRVISRLYDPRKAEIYRTLGIQTISTTTWGISHVAEMLSYNQFDSVLDIGNGNVELIRIEAPELLIGKPLIELTAIGEFQVVAISRKNKTFLPSLGTELQKNDIVYLAVLTSSISRLKSMLGLA